MKTFGDLITDVLDIINRPASESRARVAREINNTISGMQRRYVFKYTERLVGFQYPANEFTIKLDPVLEGKARNYISLQLNNSITDNPGYAARQINGKPLRLMTYGKLMREIHAYQRKNAVDEFADQILDDPRTLNTFVARTHGFFGFLLKDELGLFPTPGNAVNLMLGLNIWLPPLVNDSDTNFLLDFCYDYIMADALTRLNMSLKIDSRYSFTKDQMNTLWDSVVAWDASIENTPSETI